MGWRVPPPPPTEQRRDGTPELERWHDAHRQATLAGKDPAEACAAADRAVELVETRDGEVRFRTPPLPPPSHRGPTPGSRMEKAGLLKEIAALEKRVESLRAEAQELRGAVKVLVPVHRLPPAASSIQHAVPALVDDSRHVEVWVTAHEIKELAARKARQQAKANPLHLLTYGRTGYGKTFGPEAIAAAGYAGHDLSVLDALSSLKKAL